MGLAIANLVLAAGLLVITVTVFGRLHARLQARWSTGAHRRLLRLNGVRTVAWTAQAALSVALDAAA